jgi:hypothetical protein
MSSTLGDNINGPSVIRVPEWVKHPLGKYYMYFAHHAGQFIRMAYADAVEGPWKIYEPGVLKAADTAFAARKPGAKTHIASPDVHLDGAGQRVVMYFHGPAQTGEKGQFTQVAVSPDGLSFRVLPPITKDFYLRLFRRGDWHYGVARTGNLWRSADPFSGFDPGGNLYTGGPYEGRVRHLALLERRNTLYVFFSAIGDSPERIMLSTVDLQAKWGNWRASSPVTVLEPEKDYECAGLPLAASDGGRSIKAVRQLRDPAIFEEGGMEYLFYSVCGEQGIAGALLTIH